MPFILILAAVMLIVLNVKAIKKEENSFEAIVRNQESEITDFDVAVGELRREFSETILELQKEIYSQRDLIKDLEDKISRKNVVNINNKAEKNTKESIVDIRKITKAENHMIEVETDSISKTDSTFILEVDKIEETIEAIKTTEIVESENSIRIREIGKLIKKGVPLDDICEKYSIGKGEVLLIKELYLK
jgi:hypothetical protein